MHPETKICRFLKKIDSFALKPCQNHGSPFHKKTCRFHVRNAGIYHFEKSQK